MKRVTLADFPGAPKGSYVFEDAWLIVNDEAWTAEEWATRSRVKLDRKNARARERRANDPEYRERTNAYFSEWKRVHREELRVYGREYMRRWRAQRRAA